MNDIKVSNKKHIDYIPKNGVVCSRCVYYEKCPMEFKCETLDRLLEYYGEDFWTHLTEEDEE